MKEPEQSLVHEHARNSDQTKAKSNFGFGKLGFGQHWASCFRTELFLVESPISDGEFLLGKHGP